MVEFFKGLSFFIFPLGFGSKRLEFFENQIRKFGGSVVSKAEKATHVVVEDSFADEGDDRLSTLKLSRGGNDVKCVKVKWLCKCFSCKTLVDEQPFEIGESDKRNENGCLEVVPELRKCNPVVDECDKGVEDDYESEEKRRKMDEDFSQKFLCSRSSSTSLEKFSPTKQKIIEELEKLADAYTARNDTWRCYSYKKAINALKLYDKDITTFQEARTIPGIGEKMANKIMEIIEVGKLWKVDEIVDDKTKVLDKFCKIWGVGPSTAEGWYIQGFRTLDDLLTKGKLTKQQRIGLKYYEDFQERIPRTEVVKIAKIVEKEISKIHTSLEVELVGSFRRGKATCGDIDLMIINPGVKTPSDILFQVTEALKVQGFITDDLVNLEESEESFEAENFHKKYFGVFKLPGENQIHRRIDLFVVPKSEYAAALVHYTGSAMFNRSIKLLAGKKNMFLTEHGLYVSTLRTGSKVTSKGQLVETNTEEDIFKELGLPYRHPEERDH